MPVISAKNLSVTYFLGKSNEVRALSDATLDIEAGEFIIFFGSSGCGKSTLLYTIAGLEQATAGSVTVQGFNLATMKNKESEHYRQSTIGMVFQAFHLIPTLTVAKNIMLPRIAVGGNVKDRKEEAERLMKYFGVYEQRNKLPNELSGGQQQRVAICRALINNPDIIFADEPVGNLDSKSATDVLGLIQELNVKDKKTVILVTHDPSHLDIADRVFFMKDGKIINTKVNKETRKIAVQREASKNAPAATQPKTNLELVSETFTKVGDFGMGSMLLEYKAKEIVADVLTGMTVEEISGIEKYVKDILHSSLSSKYKDLEGYIDREYTDGGVDLNRRAAKRLVEKIRDTVEEMKVWTDQKNTARKHKPRYAERLRYHLLDRFEVSVRSTDAIQAIESIITDRIAGVTDRRGVEARLDTPVSRGGAGLDKRDAKKMAKHLELIMLGRYVIEEHPAEGVVQNSDQKSAKDI